MSSEQDESVEERMILRISSVVVGINVDSWGGGDAVLSQDWKIMVSKVEGMLAQRLVILSLKKLRKDVASVDEEIAVGRDLGILRPRREFRVFQSFFGQSLWEEMVVRK